MFLSCRIGGRTPWAGADGAGSAAVRAGTPGGLHRHRTVVPVGAADHLRCGQLENCSVLVSENPCRNRLV
ncbi:hypothetical protein HMPREF1549_03228 [Actinomyces johnsonii F0510]|uniref:Uncharacterized protein n=1 Tax=Actinomyces johnsonii F0510 TaxID=1227262 RepID=U1PYU2_9ACTO|nr:hypothetical protein HMPREF1549_03228 [Actinomyces johnsonii F0510]